MNKSNTPEEANASISENISELNFHLKPNHLKNTFEDMVEYMYDDDEIEDDETRDSLIAEFAKDPEGMFEAFLRDKIDCIRSSINSSMEDWARDFIEEKIG